MARRGRLSRALAWVALVTLSCAGPGRIPIREEDRVRIDRARDGVAEDPIIEARVAAIEAAQAREQAPMLVDEVELRVEDDYLDEHRLRALARVPITRPSELRAQRDVLAAETRIAISRLEEASLERRIELCFPSVEALAGEQRRAIYAAYAHRQRELLAWNADWLRAGMIDELRGARFELESRVKLVSWEPASLRAPERVVPVLPEIGGAGAPLARDPALLRATVRRHHPSVALRQATAERYRALSERARARGRPWLKFVDLSYEHRTDESDNGVGGQLAFEIPLGGQRANVGRYEALIRQETGEARGLVEEQVASSLLALEELHAFESRSERWLELLRLADNAEEIADRWWRERLARPAEVAALLDEAFAARNTVVDARERAGAAYCTLLAMTGVELESWPRGAGGSAEEPLRD